MLPLASISAKITPLPVREESTVVAMHMGSMRRYSCPVMQKEKRARAALLAVKY
jgi:hypothetical protein